MPVYRCLIPDSSLTHDQRSAIAEAITDVHCGLSAAPRHFVQVLFLEMEPGSELADSHGNGTLRWETPFFVAGGNRGGRPPELKGQILAGILERFAALANVAPDQVSGHISEAPASWTMENGKVLPEPGQETEEWYAHASVSG